MVDYRARTGCIIGISSRFSLTRRSVCCVFSLESPHQGDSNKYAQHTIVNLKKKITPNYPKSAATDFSKGLKNEFETAVVNEPSVFEPLKVYCIMRSKTKGKQRRSR